MPKGSPVSAESWQARHRIVRLALWLCLPTLLLVGLLGPMPPAETLVLTGGIAAFAVAVPLVRPRDVKADVAGFGVILASFAGVELSGGQIHAHLFILSAVALVALYQRWGPLLFAIAAVAVHHFVFGLIAPGRVFNMSMDGMTMDGDHIPMNELVAMVVAHVAAIGIEVFAILVFWRFSEELSDRLQQSVDALRRREEQMRHQATHDSLTGLPNRSRFGDEVMNQLRSGHPFAVLMLDLDDFKPVNDTYGHHAGDQLLISVAERLSRCLGGRDVAARLGGDEFAVLVREKTDQHGVQHVADLIIAAISEPFLLEEASVNVSVSMSIGIARTEETMSLDDLMRRADSAMYTAKRAGKGQWFLHGDEGPAADEAVAVTHRRPHE
ncbi:GGDEF domain-containing protein [Kineosporia sp. J2-2]|uniref:GGDEF domain-containing protein n=1 Tax=Kineosporia corallincola TaxID=2835133 RepID=A0ABS5TPT4_9ACTN|nr:GGDEF domain-containing protein [Kineosporia corallincola]MBT0771609.1 GGDEF domain-containing protein [Kineosporia corallincola]